MTLSLLSFLKRPRSNTNSIQHKTGKETSSKLPDQVTETKQKHQILQELLHDQTILAITPDGEDGPYNSVILKIDEEQDYFILDELKPNSGHRSLVRSRLFYANARHHGATISFKGQVSELATDKGLAFYRVPVPDKIRHAQRRQFFRVDIPVARYIPIQFVTPDGMLLHGELTDLSGGGCSIRVRNEHRIPLTRGMILPRATIDLPEHEKVATKIELCYADDWEITTNLHLGCRFIEMEKHTRRVIEHFVSELDREARKKKLAQLP